MKRFIVLLIILSGAANGFAQNQYEQALFTARAKTDSMFRDTSKHILTVDEIQSFEGLEYFGIDTQYRVVAKFKKRPKKPFEMPTSTSRKPIYRQYGYAKFTLNGKKHKLYLYQQMKQVNGSYTPKNTYLFCPFRDASNADSTYGGGRYMDVELEAVQDKTFILDFNTCYNPYCAYSHRYSCPITPRENTLDVRIEAGVKKWNHE